jgi:hypothetical protein
MCYLSNSASKTRVTALMPGTSAADKIKPSHAGRESG